jgi:hypothetical protein
MTLEHCVAWVVMVDVSQPCCLPEHSGFKALQLQRPYIAGYSGSPHPQSAIAWNLSMRHEHFGQV